MKNNHFPPEYLREDFHCVRCGVYAKQHWSTLEADGPRYRQTSGFAVKLLRVNSQFSGDLPEDYTISKCGRCDDYILWYKERIIFPRTSIVEVYNSDLPEDIKDLYNEAANIYNDSPRAAAALLRLALQLLLKELGGKGKNINDDIAAIIKTGVDHQVQKALDIIRVFGNNGAHPGEIDLQQNKDLVVQMFSLINFVADKMITQKNALENMFNGLPETVKAQIESRDKNEMDNE